ncbi:unnamed protein product [Clonostachys rhizophaga]|uniref:Beta-xylosidase C-terminal Concanavalin A-like domain-containing protein n=1 Tax=Clonostachys rhizophaga TaxID=160324 RepID=A0A9N9VH82_9HYPO|nr:unnamed protein product [Clonostachys rhizophaga]
MKGTSILAAAASVAMMAPQAAAQDTFTNPVVWQDFADLDIFRVNDTFYYSASTMHYSPGAPILRSYNLVDWEYIGSSVPELEWGEKYNLDGHGSAYVAGIWASSMRYRESNGLYYWYGCSEFAKTWVYTSPDPAGKWELAGSLDQCFYDVGILIDDDDTMYLASGRYNISVTQLSDDGLSVVRDEFVWLDSVRYLEGARFYHIDGYYYIWLTRPANEQHVLRADNPWGPYTEHSILESIKGPIPNSGVPHQGAIVDTPNGDWYYMSFLDAYPLGRIPALAPIKWEDGWPNLVTDENGAWGQSYPKPNIQTEKTVQNPLGPFTDSFNGETLRKGWEWNHNPDNSAWSLGPDGLTLKTATVTADLYAARNTLSHRIIGPKSTATFRLNAANLVSGDTAGVALLRDDSAYIGVHKNEDGSLVLQLVGNITMADNGNGWQTTSEGAELAQETAGLEAVASGEGDIWLRVTADVHPTFGVTPEKGNNPAWFEYSTDGVEFKQLGSEWQLHNRWQFFMAFRFAVFNFAESALGGSLLVKEFALTIPS